MPIRSESAIYPKDGTLLFQIRGHTRICQASKLWINCLSTSIRPPRLPPRLSNQTTTDSSELTTQEGLHINRTQARTIWALSTADVVNGRRQKHYPLYEMGANFLLIQSLVSTILCTFKLTARFSITLLKCSMDSLNRLVTLRKIRNLSRNVI